MCVHRAAVGAVQFFFIYHSCMTACGVRCIKLQNSNEDRYKVSGGAPFRNAVSGNVNKYSGYSPDEHTSPSPDQDVGVVLTDTAELEHSMTFHNLCYEVRELNKCCVNTKKILNNVRYIMRAMCRVKHA